MNERIKELADEATSYADTLDVADQKIYQKIRDREFAELIVRECLSKIEAEAAQYHEPVWAMELVNDIREHFGV